MTVPYYENHVIYNFFMKNRFITSCMLIQAQVVYSLFTDFKTLKTQIAAQKKKQILVSS